jgi:hypothetical protein
MRSASLYEQREVYLSIIWCDMAEARARLPCTGCAVMAIFGISAALKVFEDAELDVTEASKQSWT